LVNNSIGSDEVLNKNAINIHVKIQELQEWLNIKKTIEDSKLVDNVIVNSISRDEVMASINYLNPNVPIEQAFEKVGISISKQAQGFYEINNIAQ
jgi:hypothetical protein